MGTASRHSPATPHRDSTLALVGTRPSETRIHDYDEVILAGLGTHFVTEPH